MMVSAAIINLLFLLCSGFYIYLCHWYPSIILRMNGQPFAPQLGRHIGQQSQHFQGLLWHIYHDSKVDRYIHIITLILDTSIWILFICYYLPTSIQIMIVFLLIAQAISKSLIFPLSITGNITSQLVKDNIRPSITSECIHCDFEHSYPNDLRHIYLWIKMQWFSSDTFSKKIDWKEYHISICVNLFWIIIISMAHYLLTNNYIHLSHLTILHILVLINAFLRALGHILEPIPPFIDGNEHFLEENGFYFIVGLLKRGLIHQVIRLTVIGFVSEYQAGLPYALPQILLHELFARILRPWEEKPAKNHYRHKVKTIHRKGWKSTAMTEHMFKPFFKTH